MIDTENEINHTIIIYIMEQLYIIRLYLKKENKFTYTYAIIAVYYIQHKQNILLRYILLRGLYRKPAQLCCYVFLFDI